MLSQGIAPIAPFIQSEFALSRAEVGLLNLALAVGSYLTVAISGRLIDRLGERTMLTASGIIGGVFAASLLLARNYPGALVLVALTSVGVAIQTPAGSKAVMGWFELKMRGTAMGIRQVGIPLGGMIASLLLPSLALVAGWRGAYAVAGGCAAVGAVACWLTYRDPPVADGAPSGVPKLVGVRDIVRDRDLWRLSLYSVGTISAQFTFTLYLVIFATERLGLPEVAAGALLALGQAVGVLARIGWGVLSDRAFGGDRRPALN
ncbi:MAG: MFS transporter, partial [Chloroflexi bacterium]|nr:MFS transporter [Chloroflexota bacterium]